MTPLDTTDFPQGHGELAAHTEVALGGTTSEGGHAPLDAQYSAAPLGSDIHGGQNSADAQRASAVVDPSLLFAAKMLDEMEATRKSLANRYQNLTTSGESENGVTWGYGLDDRDPQVARAGAILDEFKALEHQAVLNLQRALRKHPLGPWVKAQKGAGEKTVARLLGAIGDPYWHTAEDRPRTVSELWAYCGLKPGQRRRKGERANWSNEAKMRTYLLSESFLKQLDPRCKTDTGIADHQDGCKCSPYRIVIDARRRHTAERVHETECVRCGPSGKPAQPGTPWSPAHQLADALRVAGKTFLRDLWREAKRIHDENN